ncbi:MAG TPA: hypothetical protein PLN69_05040 [bacterium]|nr:hypothetical protein [bacterium]
MRSLITLIIVCVIAALMPVLSQHVNIHTKEIEKNFPGWPPEFNETVFKELPLTDQEKAFEKSFPGKMGKFTDGTKEILIRWITHETRKLHPSADCYRGTGYKVTPLPIEYDNEGKAWGKIKAEKDDVVFIVHERFYDNDGKSWPDVSSWFWAAFSGKSEGPWWAVTVSETVE